MKESSSMEKKAGSAPRRDINVSRSKQDGRRATDALQRARCTGCHPSSESTAGLISRMPPMQRQAAVLSLQRTRGNIFVQRMAAPMQSKCEINRTGMPDGLKAGIESLSGMNISDVRVHTSSDKPAHLNALAYTQGNEIHLGPGQEQYLPHEAWHAVQQMQGRIKPTLQTKDVFINDSEALESEADIMGARSLKRSCAQDRAHT